MGDSIVRWAGQDCYQLQGGGVTVWHGVSGARMAGFSNRVFNTLDRNPRPSTIIIHIGTNDIFSSPLGYIRKRIRENITDLRNMLPDARLIWSSILPRLFYYGETSQGAGERVRIKLNLFAQKLCRELVGMHIIKHDSSFPAFNHALYRHDGIHLSEQGNIRFQRNMENALVFFNLNPDDLEFPFDNQ
jgi:lysophospholipase L1-like esterase